MSVRLAPDLIHNKRVTPPPLSVAPMVLRTWTLPAEISRLEVNAMVLDAMLMSAPSAIAALRPPKLAAVTAFHSNGVGSGDGAAEAVGAGERVGLLVGRDVSLPPPHAQHISFELKSASSYLPHQAGFES